MNASTLLMIPCCKDKASGGRALPDSHDPLATFVSKEVYGDLLQARLRLLNQLKSRDPMASSLSLNANSKLSDGVEFGKTNSSGQYLEAITRYTGFLYSVRGFEDGIRKALDNPDGPRILILSALYGPLHPLSHIQDYDLRMDDKLPSSAWMKSLPKFLEAFISINGIRDVRFYFGRTTKYLRVASRAIQPLVSRSEITATYYDVVNGNSRETPRNHGIRFLKDLGCSSVDSESRTITECSL